jgi:hypothetical protein
MTTQEVTGIMSHSIRDKSFILSGRPPNHTPLDIYTLSTSNDHNSNNNN